MVQVPNRGLNRASGKETRPGTLLLAGNSRYKPGDLRRLWALQGRTRFNTTPFAYGARLWRTFPYNVDGGTSKAVVHIGTELWEADLGLTGLPSPAKDIGGDGSFQSNFLSYGENLYYLAKSGTASKLWVRETAGWRRAGHTTQNMVKLGYAETAYFMDAWPFGAGTFESLTHVKWTYRIYDSVTDTESEHGSVWEYPGFAACLGMRIMFTSAIPTTVGEFRGSHVRLYRTLIGEEPGLFYRIDGNGDGIPLPLAGDWEFIDNCDNTTSQTYGRVRGDGEEGSNTWAEHGGPIPDCTGMCLYKDRFVFFGMPDRPNEVIGSAFGYPEAVPVDWDGEYTYNLKFTTPQVDKVVTARQVGPFLLVWQQNSVWKVSQFPDFTDTGFDKRIQDSLATDHGIVGPLALDTFGTGPEESQTCVYVSREFGPMVTNGYTTKPVIQTADWSTLIRSGYESNTVVRNYSTMQEMWVFYTPPGSTVNTKAIILDYSAYEQLGIRVTGPVDVVADDAFFAFGNDDIGRFYLMPRTDATLYVQDQGKIDQQFNTNMQGGIAVTWSLPQFSVGKGSRIPVRKVYVSGGAGEVRTFRGTLFVQEGDEEYSQSDDVPLGPGEVISDCLGKATGQAARFALTYTGPTGSDYDDASADCAPFLSEVELETEKIRHVGRTRG